MNCNFSIGMYGYCPHKKETKMSMTKYGVELDAEKIKELDEEKTKQASKHRSERGACPTCRNRLDDAGACPVHGTEPLEPVKRKGR